MTSNASIYFTLNSNILKIIDFEVFEKSAETENGNDFIVTLVIKKQDPEFTKWFCEKNLITASNGITFGSGPKVQLISPELKGVHANLICNIYLLENVNSGKMDDSIRVSDPNYARKVRDALVDLVNYYFEGGGSFCTEETSWDDLKWMRTTIGNGDDKFMNWLILNPQKFDSILPGKTISAQLWTGKNKRSDLEEADYTLFFGADTEHLSKGFARNITVELNCAMIRVISKCAGLYYK